MTKVTLNPTETVLAAAAVTDEVIDSAGRIIKVKRPKPLDRLGLIAAIGPDLAQNSVYFSQVYITVCVSEIDGEAVFPPATLREVQAIYQRLDDHGLAAVQEWLLAGVQAEEDRRAATKK